jgi:hypothetical protein
MSLPINWDDWRAEWSAWLAEHRELAPVRKAIPGQNLMADEILGTYRLPDGRTVELSEVTFLDERGVGLTWVDDRSGNVVHSFDELEAELGL